MDNKEIRDISNDEIDAKVRELQGEIVKYKMKVGSGGLRDNKVISRKKKIVARLLTEINARKKENKG